MTAIFQVAGGLGLFLLGMVVMTGALRSLAGEALTRSLARFTRSPASGALTGALTTALIQSSSATTLAAPPLHAMETGRRRHPSQIRNSWYTLFFQLRGLADRVVAARDFAFVEKLWRDWSPGWRWDPEHPAAGHTSVSSTPSSGKASNRTSSAAPRSAR